MNGKKQGQFKAETRSIKMKAHEHTKTNMNRSHHVNGSDCGRLEIDNLILVEIIPMYGEIVKL